MKASFSFLVLLLALSIQSGAAAPLERDLGRGLAYVRATQLPEDLPTKTTAPRSALVLDLRFTPADDTAAQTFGAWLKFRASPAAPITVLVNGDTSPLLLRVFLAQPLPPGVVTLGPESTDFTPDVSVHVLPQDDRLAYDALAAATAVDDLITRKLDKPRNDEARLARQHANGADEEDSAPTPATPAPAAPATAVKVPPTDLVLARAVQLHRALLALRRLP
jgi:hypothetical protein